MEIAPGQTEGAPRGGREPAIDELSGHMEVRGRSEAVSTADQEKNDASEERFLP
jgi:hypothetical protein